MRSIPLFVTSGNKHSMQSATPRCAVYMTLDRTEHDFQSWTRKRSKSNHCPKTASPMACLILTRNLGRSRWPGMRIVKCRRSRCVGVMVWSGKAIHSTLHELSQNVMSLSFVAFEKSIGVGSSPFLNRSKLPVWTQTPNGTYWGGQR